MRLAEQSGTIAVQSGVGATHGAEQWAEARYNVTQWTEMPSGGHFAALEEPDLLVRDIRAFFRGLR